MIAPDAADLGTAPTFSAVSCTPNAVTVGIATDLMCQGSFTDPDGDLASLELSVMLPNGTSQSVGSVSAAGAAGMTSGQLGVQLMDFNAPIAGDYVFDGYLVDLAGNQSNHQMTTVTASAPPP